MRGIDCSVDILCVSFYKVLNVARPPVYADKQPENRHHVPL